MKRYKLTISYDGTSYSGWQVQPNGESIQKKIQQALEITLRHTLALTGSGRTDAGVHALGQTAHFDTEETPKLLSLNALLPPDIRITALEEVPGDFHARYSATAKIYHYHLHTHSVADPFRALYSHHVLGPLNIGLLKEAAQKFIGTHDFAAFANAKETKIDDTIRTLYRLDVIETPQGLRLEFEGEGFLYKMVRNITGFLIDIGQGRHKIEDLPSIFVSRDRKRAGLAAPAKGLFLMEVKYDQ